MLHNDTHNQKMTPKQRRCVASLVAGQSYTLAALAAGVTPRTIARWRELPHFEKALQTAGRRSIADATRQITAGLETAVSFLLEVIQNETAPASVRTRAALGLIDRQIRLVEVNDILERLAALEQRI